ncbi:MAG: methyltransferase domain-containing protein [Bacteroidia bacterium]|nr:methyltransferase domain-containing protein [Bacteroidia bacterium]
MKHKVGTGNESARKEWVEQQLLSIPKGWRILDAGAGEQQYKKFCEHLNYVSQDFAQYQPESVEVGLQMGNWDYGKLDIISDINNIPEEDASFDAVLCTEVFEHIPKPIDAILEFSRLIKPGGKLILSAPFCSMTHFAPYHFYTGFNKFFYEEHLTDAGFNIDDISYNGNYFEYLAQELIRLESMISKYGGTSLSIADRFATKRLLSTLQNASDNDKGSTELMSYGIHVIATRISK